MLPVRTLALVLLAAGCSASGPSAETPPTTSTPESAKPIDTSASAQPEPVPSTPTTASAAANPAPNEPAAAQPAGPPPPLPTGTTVLHIGDSMAGALGVSLNEELKKAGVKGVLRFKTASFIPTWAWSKDLPVLLAHHNPDLILITLGANEVAIKDPEIRAATVKKLVGRFEGRPCVWIAPPLWAAGDTGLLPVIRRNAAPCRYMDTNAIVKEMPRLDDKIHPTMTARKEWAKTVVDWLARERKPDGARPWELKSEP